MSARPQSGAEMATRYDPAEVEPKWAEAWVERGYFTADPTSGKPPYCIVIPPPNVTGRLHVGHALGRTLEDTLIRRARMQGFEALWLPGMDHAGIATQVVVERKLREEGIDRRELGREAFVERVWAWKEQYGGEIVEQIKRMGASCDWSRERFTMDEGLSQAVRVAFVRLYEAGLIYRGERLVNWCPTDHTGLSDSEVEHVEVAGELVTFRYPLTDHSGAIEVATTRVETMLGDTGIAVHPSDERYAALVGRTVTHPFDGREIPIVADHHVDKEFGTGAVKVTPAHDPNDFDIAQRTGLPLMNIFDATAHLTDAVPEAFRGLDRYAARKAVRDRLEEAGLLVAEERPYLHAVGHCYRCHAEIEPWIAGLQWFVKVSGLTGPAKEAALDGARAVRARTLAAPVHGLARQPPRLEHLPPAVVGSPDPGLVLPGRSRHRGGGGSDHLCGVRPRRAAPGRGRARHVVLVAAVAVLDAGLARGHGGPARLLSERRARDGVRDPLPLGGADDHVGPVPDGGRAVPRRRHPRARARPAGTQDVQVARQRDRSDGDDRPLRRRRVALLARARRDRGAAGHPALGGGDRGRPELREQALERLEAGPARLSRGARPSCRPTSA